MSGLDNGSPTVGGIPSFYENGGLKSYPERDKRIMATNDSSIVSKCAVEKKFYPKPHFYHFFVDKTKRRAPLISRGYWLRMKLIESVLQRFLDMPQHGQQKVVLNLGAGFDPLAFRSLAADQSAPASVVYVDIDYPKVIQNKVSIIEDSEDLYQLCLHRNTEREDSHVKFWSETYIAIGCDLGDLESFQNVIVSALPLFWKSNVLWISEVSTCYMHTGDADRLIELAGRHKSSIFCLLEQFLPQGAAHPFASQMLQHFVKLKSPLQAVQTYSSLNDQRRRFEIRGWQVHCNSLWDHWTAQESMSLLGEQDRGHLHTCEAFDEWEEFALFASHYLLLIAYTDLSAPLVSSKRCPPVTSASEDYYLETVDVSIVSMELNINRRYGALSTCNGILHFLGGHDDRTRTNETNIISPGERHVQKVLSPSKLSPRMCHTVTALKEDGTFLLVGGRSSPSQVFSDCWIFDCGNWRQVEPLPIALYRHSATPVELFHGVQGVLVYGGRTSDGTASASWYLWIPSYQVVKGQSSVDFRAGWTQVACETARAAFAATITSKSNQPRGILLGGLNEEGRIVDNFHEWRLTRSGIDWRIELSLLNSTMLRHREKLTRFGSTVTEHNSTWLIIGGINKNGPLPRDEEILILDHQLLDALVDGDKPADDQKFVLFPDGRSTVLRSKWPLLVGHSVCYWEHRTFLVGGGATCFSFGSSHNEDLIVIQL